MTAPVRIFGIGSPFGDDRVGWLAAEALQGRFDPAEVDVSIHDRPGLRLVTLMQGAALVVLVDAVKSGAAPGSLHRLGGEGIIKAVARYTSTHGFGLVEAMQLAQRLGELPQKIVLWGVEIGSLAGADDLSPAVREALPGLIEGVAGEVSPAADARRL